MLLTRLKQRLQHDSDPDDRKLIKSVLDIINSPANQHTESRTGSAKQSSGDQQKIVLHIDDDPDDREMVSEAIKLIDPSYIIYEADCGESGIEFLHKAKASGNLPCLIILDINMPGLDGFETYNEIRKDDSLKAIPTVIFTTTSFFKGRQREGNEHLPIFIKPDNTRDFAASIRKLLTHCKDAP